MSVCHMITCKILDLESSFLVWWHGSFMEFLGSYVKVIWLRSQEQKKRVWAKNLERLDLQTSCLARHWYKFVLIRSRTDVKVMAVKKTKKSRWSHLRLKSNFVSVCNYITYNVCYIQLFSHLPKFFSSAWLHQQTSSVSEWKAKKNVQ